MKLILKIFLQASYVENMRWPCYQITVFLFSVDNAISFFYNMFFRAKSTALSSRKLHFFVALKHCELRGETFLRYAISTVKNTIRF